MSSSDETCYEVSVFSNPIYTQMLKTAASDGLVACKEERASSEQTDGVTVDTQNSLQPTVLSETEDWELHGQTGSCMDRLGSLLAS